MKFICSKALLLDIINTVQRAVPTKSTNPILECIKIDADARGSIRFTGNNTELCIEYTADCNIIRGGEMALDSKMFGDIIRRLPDGDVSVDVNEENHVTKIQAGRTELNIRALDAIEFPTAPEFDEKYSFSLSQAVLKKIVRQTIFAVSMNMARPIQTGMLFEVNGDALSVVAVDGVRLALRNCKIASNGAGFKFVVPGNTLRELLKILKDDEEPVNIKLSDKHCMFDFGYYNVVTRLLEGDFLNYKPLLSTHNTIEVEVEVRPLCESLERASLLVNDDTVQKNDKVPVRLKPELEKMQINCMTSKGMIHDVIPVRLTGDELEIGFNYKYLLDALRATEEEKVKMEMSSPNSSCFIRSVGDEDYIYIVQPIRLYQ